MYSFGIFEPAECEGWLHDVFSGGATGALESRRSHRLFQVIGRGVDPRRFLAFGEEHLKGRGMKGAKSMADFITEVIDLFQSTGVIGHIMGFGLGLFSAFVLPGIFSTSYAS